MSSVFFVFFLLDGQILDDLIGLAQVCWSSSRPSSRISWWWTCRFSWSVYDSHTAV